MNDSSTTRSNVTLVSNVHLRQRGVDAADDAEFRRHIFGRESLEQLIPALRPGPANTDRSLLRDIIGPSQIEYFDCLPCRLCGRRDYWYRRFGRGYKVIFAPVCMCRRQDQNHGDRATKEPR